jgi:hypothetical protein
MTAKEFSSYVGRDGYFVSNIPGLHLRRELELVGSYKPNGLTQIIVYKKV